MQTENRKVGGSTPPLATHQYVSPWPPVCGELSDTALDSDVLIMHKPERAELGSLAPATRGTDHVQYLPATCPKLPESLPRSSVMAGSRLAAAGPTVCWLRTIGSASGLTMTALTWAGQRWPGSPRTMVTPLLSCASYRTMII